MTSEQGHIWTPGPSNLARYCGACGVPMIPMGAAEPRWWERVAEYRDRQDCTATISSADTMPAQGWLIPSGTYSEPHLVTDAGRNPAPREENPNMADPNVWKVDPTLTADSIPEPLGWSEGHQAFGEVAAVAERAKHDREMFVIETTIDTLANRYREAQRAERYLEEKAAQLRTLRAEIVRGLRHFASELDPEERAQDAQGYEATHG